MHVLHLPRFWKHKETNEVIDHLTYSDLKGKPQSSDFEECDVTGELLSKKHDNISDALQDTGSHVNVPNDINKEELDGVIEKTTNGAGIDLDEIEALATTNENTVVENNEPVVEKEPEETNAN